MTATSIAGETTPAVTTIPGVYWLWLAGLAWTGVGMSLLSFGRVWTATAHSASFAGMVLLATTLPRVALALFGGAFADRLGPLRVMLGVDATMAAFTAGVAVVALVTGPHPALLITAAAVLGTADAFYQPGAGSVPKIMVPAGGLPRAMAARQVVVYFSSVVGPALGGVVVSAAGLPLSFALGAVGFAGMMLILILVRRRVPATAPGGEPATSPGVLAQMRDGLAFAVSAPLLRAVIIMTAAFALFVLPLTSMLVPLVARANSWDAALAGTTAGVFSAGMAVLALYVMWRRGAQRAGVAAIAGMVLTGAGILGLAAAPAEPLAISAVLAAGLGAGLFSTHVGPLFVAATPPDYIARVQSVMMIAQAAPLMLAGPIIGVLADLMPVAVVTVIWGSGAAAVALGTLLSRPLRTARRPG